MDLRYFINNIRKSFFSGNAKTITVTICTLILLPLIINKIGIENYGILSLSMVFGGLFGSFELGISKTLTVLFSQSNDKEKSHIFSNAFLIMLFLLLIIGALFIIVNANFNIFGENKYIDRELGNFIVFTSYISVILILLNNLLLASLQGYLFNHYADLGWIVFSLCFHLFLIVAAFNFDSIYIIILMPILAYFFQAIFLSYVLFSKTKLKFGKVDNASIRTMLYTSIDYFKIGLTTIFLQPINKYLLFYLTGNAGILGLFDIALKLGNISASLLNATSQPLLAIFSKMGENTNKINSLSNKVSIFIFFQYIAGLFIFFVLGESIVSFLVTENNQLLYYISFLLIASIASTAISEPFFKFLLSQKPPKYAFYSKLSIPISNVLFFMLIDHSNILLKITYAFAIAFGVVNNIFTYFFYRKSIS